MPTSLGTGVPKPHHDLRVPADLIATAERGLGAGGRPRKRVLIIGAGLAGLVASLVNARNRRRVLAESVTTAGADPVETEHQNDTEPTTVLEENR